MMTIKRKKRNKQGSIMEMLQVSILKREGTNKTRYIVKYLRVSTIAIQKLQIVIILKLITNLIK